MDKNKLDYLNMNKEFEFNDGVGDVLKEKEVYKFSWGKTLGVFFVGLVAVIMLTVGILEISKKFLEISSSSVSKNIPEAESFDDMMKEINNNNWEALPEVESRVIAPSSPLVQNTAETKTKSVPKAKVTTIQTQAPQVKVVSEKKVEPIKQESVQVNGTKKVEDSRAPLNKTVYKVIAGSFSSYENAKISLQNLKKKGFDGYILTDKINGKLLHKIQVGAFSNYKNAQVHTKKLSAKSFDSYIVTQ